jgi:Arc/MetJ family transcription regulator
VAVQKVSVSLEHELVEAARERVGGRGMSAYVNEAVRRQLRRDALAELLADLRDEHGPVPDNYVEEVRRLWPAPGELAKSRPA